MIVCRPIWQRLVLLSFNSDEDKFPALRLAREAGEAMEPYQPHQCGQ